MFHFKKSVIPRLRSLVQAAVLREEIDVSKETHLRPSLAEKTAAAAAAAADIAQASEELLNSKLQGQANSHAEKPLSNSDFSASTTISRQPYANGKIYWDYSSVGRSSIPRASLEPSAAPHPRSYMEVIY
ncbi:hypothetical protein SAY86_024099 [Trapa natans]|uniref:Peroxisomal membrane protein PEX14 central plants domain-containing protein n=1 Tax=Trapa natans TaxID=22666 RepID=A0AAN7LYJ8_TRANT|nr:hypothetical protein SAY86_024099 [Trapa natans]